MDYFLFLVNKLPGLALSRDGVVGFDVTGAKVRVAQRGVAAPVRRSFRPLGLAACKPLAP
jgi:hypothetical protein